MTAVHAINPFKYRKNTDKGTAWNKIKAEVSATLALKGLPPRDLASMKAKWTDLSNQVKSHLATTTHASGVVEHMTEMQKMIEEVIQSDLGNQHPRPSDSTAQAYQSRLAMQTTKPYVSTAAHAMTTRTQRRVSNTLESAASDTLQNQDAGGTPTRQSYAQEPTRKRARIALADTLDGMMDADERHRQEANRILWEDKEARQKFQEAKLRAHDSNIEIKRRQLDLQEKHYQVQERMVDVGNLFLTKMSSKISSVRSNMALLNQSVREMMQAMLRLQPPPSTAMATSSSMPSTVASRHRMDHIPEEPQTPRAQRSTSVESRASLTPTRTRRSSCAPSVPRTGKYGGFGE